LFYYLFKKIKTNGHPFVRPRLSANQELREVFLPILEAFVDRFVFNESLSSSNFSISASPRLANLSVEEAICISFVLRKKQFLSPSAAVIISMESASQCDSRRHSNMAQTRPNFFILTL
jgi:hypothetical protein